MNVQLLRDTFEQVRPRAVETARAFYDNMFRVYPQVRPLFAATDFDEQPKKLVASLAAVVTLADKPDELSPLLEELGRSHVGYGVEPHHYPYVSASLLRTLADTFGDAWTEEAAETWAQALALVSERMIEAQRAVA